MQSFVYSEVGEELLLRQALLLVQRLLVSISVTIQEGPICLLKGNHIEPSISVPEIPEPGILKGASSDVIIGGHTLPCLGSHKEIFSWLGMNTPLLYFKGLDVS